MKEEWEFMKENNTLIHNGTGITTSYGQASGNNIYRNNTLIGTATFGVSSNGIAENNKVQGKMTASANSVVTGNVIGGGDFAQDRIIPDCVRAMEAGKVIEVRNPHSVRPYQHVLEPLAVYLMIAEKQYEDVCYSGYYNVGPEDCDCITTGELADFFCRYWNLDNGHNNQVEANKLFKATWESKVEQNALHEANFLKLDCSLLKKTFGWQPRWHMDTCMAMTCRFAKVWRDRYMDRLARVHPLYGFEENKGYGTMDHLARIACHGPCPVHRLTFQGVKEHVGKMDAVQAHGEEERCIAIKLP